MIFCVRDVRLLRIHWQLEKLLSSQELRQTTKMALMFKPSYSLKFQYTKSHSCYDWTMNLTLNFLQQEKKGGEGQWAMGEYHIKLFSQDLILKYRIPPWEPQKESHWEMLAMISSVTFLISYVLMGIIGLLLFDPMVTLEAIMSKHDLVRRVP